MIPYQPRYCYACSIVYLLHSTQCNDYNVYGTFVVPTIYPCSAFVTLGFHKSAHLFISSDVSKRTKQLHVIRRIMTTPENETIDEGTRTTSSMVACRNTMRYSDCHHNDCDCTKEEEIHLDPISRTTTQKHDTHAIHLPTSILSTRQSPLYPVLRNVHQSTIPSSIWQKFFVPSINAWDLSTVLSFINSQHSRPCRGADIIVEWNETNTSSSEKLNTETIRHKLYNTTVEQLLSLYEQSTERLTTKRKLTIPHQIRDQMSQDIATAMNEFSTFCYTHCPTSQLPISFSLRLLCNYGSAATKCPQWHIDQVPCRYIQTLHGPGCMFINDPNCNQIVYDRIQQLYQLESDTTTASPPTTTLGSRIFSRDENFIPMSAEERNQFLLQNVDPIGSRSTSSTIGQANVGEGIILLGNSWWGSSRSNQHNSTIAAVHKSPLHTPSNNGRILLTMNVHCSNNI
jgi:Protein of unknown function (DUF1826)